MLVKYQRSTFDNSSSKSTVYTPAFMILSGRSRSINYVYLPARHTYLGTHKYKLKKTKSCVAYFREVDRLIL